MCVWRFGWNSVFKVRDYFLVILYLMDWFFEDDCDYRILVLNLVNKIVDIIGINDF